MPTVLRDLRVEISGRSAPSAPRAPLIALGMLRAPYSGASCYRILTLRIAVAKLRPRLSFAHLRASYRQAEALPRPGPLHLFGPALPRAHPSSGRLAWSVTPTVTASPTRLPAASSCPPRRACGRFRPLRTSPRDRKR